MPTSLKIWPFDNRISWDDKENLLRYFGAIKILPSKRCGNSDAVIAEFQNESDCEFALKNLHQQDLGVGKRLIAVYYDLSDSRPPSLQKKKSNNKIEQNVDLQSKLEEYQHQLCFINKIHSINHPISPKLKYLYPPPSPSILANIALALDSKPRFYTQVLHLMNKMCLPPPFDGVEPKNYILAEFSKLWQSINNQKNVLDPMEVLENVLNDGESSTTESELETDDEQTNIKRTNNLPIKRKIKPESHIISKKRKLELLKKSSEIQPNKDPNTTHNLVTVFEVEKQSVKKIEVNIQSATLDKRNTEDVEIIGGGFGVIEAPQVDKDDSQLENKTSSFITDEELLENKVSKSDWPIIPVFKNYNPGTPSVKLYIKNLAKNTTEESLRYIYGRYIFRQDYQQVETFNIRLMKEGRMKGQAFVTFPKEEQAIKALEDTNGYILNDKPMVVMFGRVKSS